MQGFGDWGQGSTGEQGRGANELGAGRAVENSMATPRPAVGNSHRHSLDSVPSLGPGQIKYSCAGIAGSVYSVGLLGAKREMSAQQQGGARHTRKHEQSEPPPISLGPALVITSLCRGGYVYYRL